MRDKAIMFLFDKDDLLLPLNISYDKKTDEEQTYVLDYFDFNTNSLEDFIDYLEFLDFEEYYIVCNNVNGRIKKVINIISDYVGNTAFTILSIDSVHDFLESKKVPVNIDTIKEKLKELEELDANKIFNNGYICYKTGMYPMEFRNGLIKHISLFSKKQLSNIDSSLMKNFALNSCVYYYEDYISSEDTFPFILKSIKDFKKIDNSIDVISKNELKKILKIFVQKGQIASKNYLIANYAHYLGLSRLNSLTIGKTGTIYLDDLKELKVGQVKTTYKSIYNRFTTVFNYDFKDFSKELCNYFPTYCYLQFLNKKHMLTFITPYNNQLLNFKRETSFHSLSAWIGYTKDTGNMTEYYMHNIVENRLFLVNAEFINAFEFLVKGVEYKDQDIVNKVKVVLQKNGKKSN